MKRLFCLFACATCVITLVACGGKTKKEKSGKLDAEEVVEKLAETGVFGEWSKDAAKAAFKKIDIKLDDISPDFEFYEVDSVKIYHGTVYRDNCEAQAYFIKKDLSPVTNDEMKAHARKMYELTQKIADDNKVIYGFELKDSADEALAEFALDDVMAKKGVFGFPPTDYSWCFKKDGVIRRMEVELVDANAKYPERIKVEFSSALQKSFKETMDEAEKALEKLDDKDIEKAMKEALK